MNWSNVRNFERIGYGNPEEKDIFKLDETPYSLLQIQNNYGKTTTMHLLRSIFTGIKIPKNFRDGYRYRKGDSGWGGDRNAPSVFGVMFEINGEICEIQTQINPHTKEQKFFTYREKWGNEKGRGRRDGWKPPAIFQDLFKDKESFVNLIILDGEKARELNQNTGSNVIGRAIKQVTGLEKVTDLIDEGSNDGRINEVVKEILSKDLGSSGGKNSSLKEKLKEAIGHSGWIQNELEMKQEELAKHNVLLNANRVSLSLYDADIFSTDSKWVKANKDVIKAREHLKRETKMTIQRLYNPTDVFDDSIWTDVKKFYKSQVQGKLPKSVSSNWFEEIMDSYEKCICGTEWTEDMKTHISNNKDEFLEELLMTRVKSLQATIVNTSKNRNLGEIRTALDAFRDDLRQKEKKARNLKSGLLTPEDRVKYEKLIGEKVILEGQCGSIQHHIEMHESTNRDFIKLYQLDHYTMTNSGVPTIQPHIFREIQNLFEMKKIEKHITSLILKSSDSATKADGAKILHDILEKATERLLREVKSELQIEVNNIAENMAGLDVTVEITEKKLVFKNPGGSIQEEVNESGELGAIYGLVSALNKYSDVSLPIIVDTPLAGMGVGMVNSWKEVIPASFDQVIALINSTEKNSLRFWWENEEELKDITVFTMMRKNEHVNYGYDNIQGDPPTGKMYITSSLETFDNYEKERHLVQRKRGGE